jgi:hypothetical protein
MKDMHSIKLALCDAGVTRADRRDDSGCIIAVKPGQQRHQDISVR